MGPLWKCGLALMPFSDLQSMENILVVLSGVNCGYWLEVDFLKNFGNNDFIY